MCYSGAVKPKSADLSTKILAISYLYLKAIYIPGLENWNPKRFMPVSKN